MYEWNDGSYLVHHGIKGQQWGIRRFQNEDGSYTSQGQQQNSGHGRYAPDSTVSGSNKSKSSIGSKTGRKTIGNRVSKKWNSLSDRQRTVIKIGAAVAATALVAYGAYKLTDGKIKGNSVSGRERVDSIINKMKKASHDINQATVNLNKFKNDTKRAIIISKQTAENRKKKVQEQLEKDLFDLDRWYSGNYSPSEYDSLKKRFG